MIPSHLQHTRVPYQIKRCSLYGVRPLTLSLSPAATPVYSVCDVWDNSAVQRMNKLIEGSVVRKAQVMKVTPKGVHQVKLYLQTSDDQFCLNDRLIQEEYCVADPREYSDSEGSISDSVSSSLSDGMRSINSSDEVTQRREHRKKTRNEFASRNIHAELLTEIGLTNEVKVRAENYSTLEAQERVVLIQTERQITTEQQQPHSRSSSTLCPSLTSDTQEQLASGTGQGATLPSSSPIAMDRVHAQVSSVREPGDILRTNLPGAFSSENCGSHPVVQNHFSHVVPKSLIPSDSEDSSSSETSINRNLKLIPEELSKLSKGDAVCCSDSDLSVSSDPSLMRYEDHSSRSLLEVVHNLENKLASKSPSPGPFAGTSHSPGPSNSSDPSQRPTSAGSAHSTIPSNVSGIPVSAFSGSLVDFEKKTGDRNLSTSHSLRSGDVSEVEINQEQIITAGNRMGDSQMLSPLSKTTPVEGDHSLSTPDPHVLDLSVDHVLSGLLSLDPSAPGLKTRRPKLPLNGSEGLKGRMGRGGKVKSPSGRVCFSDDEQIHGTSRTEKKVVKSPKTPPIINKKNIALKSILKNYSSMLPEEPRPKQEQPHSPVTFASAEDITDRSSIDSSQSDQENPVLRKTQLGNRILANRLLTQLAGQTKCSQTLDLKTEEPEKYGSFYRPPDGVYVAADIKLRPVETLDGVPFDDRVIKVLRSKKLDSPLLIQSYCWPPVLRGRDVIGIAPRNKGQILAYLAPLLTQLIENKLYPEGGGPLVLILCSSWRRAQEIQCKCETILGELTFPRVMTIFGGGREEVYNIPLINGCEILIATPHCLTRKLDKYVSLRRLGHLVSWVGMGVGEAGEHRFMDTIKSTNQAKGFL
ncbi:uncharacterized protein LOC135475845 [Liolophura sinensis]|uniref:uncharacterized protein LOC135475845 n=1 Tax=Liolophura sinensis TaxID=3198878 RepID=UPI0031585296